MTISIKYMLALLLPVTMATFAHEATTHHAHLPNLAQLKQVDQTPIYHHTIYQPNNPLFYPNQPITNKTAPPQLTYGVSFNEQYINQKIAQWSLQQVNGSLPLIDDPWVNQFIWQMTANMNAQVRSQSLLSVPIINDTAINAFAVPGGLIGLNAGVVLSAGALDEVASVLAHEIAHLSQRHYEHSQDNNSKLLALQLGGLLAAIAASAVSGDAAAVAMIGSQTISAENRALHSREHEKEADRVGMRILAQSGYDAKAMPRFFERLHKQTALHQFDQAFIPSFMQSHPFTAERLSEATSRASHYNNVSMAQKQSQAQDFDKLTWRLKYLTKQVNLAELSTAQSVGAKLALVAYLADEGKIEQATQVFELARFDTSDPLVCVTWAHLLSAKKDYKEAVDVLQACHSLYPERRDLRLHLADALIKLNQPAHILLQPLVNNMPHDKLAWELMQQTYENQARHTKNSVYKDVLTSHALRARSQVQLWQAKYLAALQSNAQASEMIKNHQGQQALQSLLEKDKAQILSFQTFK